MKRFFGLLLLSTAAFLLGCVATTYTRQPATTVNAQSSPIATPHLICAGTHDCGQYVIEVNTQRGFGRFAVYQVPDQAHYVDTLQLANVGGGDPSFSLDAFEPTSRETVQMTISATEQ